MPDDNWADPRPACIVGTELTFLTKRNVLLLESFVRGGLKKSSVLE